MKIWMKVVMSVVLAFGSACGLSAQTATREVRTGVLAGPIIGIKYETASGSGMTNEKGEFKYRAGETVTFSVGGIVLGSTRANQRVNLAQLVDRVRGNIDKLRDPIITNMARFVQTLDQDGDIENGVTIAPQAHTIIGRRPLNFNQSEEAFARDFTLVGVLDELNNANGVFSAKTPRALRSPEAARNELRRNIRGIIKMTDVKIPTRDGAYVLADVFRPADGGKYPVVMNFGLYGKAFERECICNLGDAQRREVMEDQYSSGNPTGLMYENHETVNTSEWVPKGYTVIRIDGRGTCNTPGTVQSLSRQEAEDFYDSVEWAGVQSWSNGNVGLWGVSYYGMNQYNVASLQPPHLKAMIPVATDIESYGHSLYHDGLFNEEWTTDWWYNAEHAVCGKGNHKDFISVARAHPFNDPAIYGPKGEIWMSPEMDKVTIPQWISMPTIHRGHIHQLASSDAFILSPAKDKHLDMSLDMMAQAYADISEHMAFFDYWLKGIKNNIMETPRVRLSMRTGDGGYYLMNENEWPIARTQYTKLYLDASPSNWQGEGRRHDFLRMSASKPAAEKKSTYSAEVLTGSMFPPVTEDLRRRIQHNVTACWASGVSFVTDPVQEDMVLAGYFKLGLWVSSTSSDMDIDAAVRVIDSNNQEVDYTGAPDLTDDANVYPLSLGWLKVSHRKLDTKLSTDYAPRHTNLEADYAPLKNNEVVPVEVLLWPDTGVVKKGDRIRVDVQPRDGCGSEHHYYDPSYHTGADNTIYTGPNHPSYLQLPLIPAGGTASAKAAE